MTKARNIVAVAFAAVLATQAYAQSSPGYLRVGFTRFDSAAAGNASAENGFILGYGQAMSMPGMADTNTGWEVGWMRNGGSNSADTYYAMLRFSKTLTTGFSAGVGLGGAFHDINVVGLDKTAAMFAASAFVDYHFTSTASLELGYFWSGKVNGFKTDRWTASVGFRF